LYKGYFAIVGVDPNGNKWKDLGGDDMWIADGENDTLQALSKTITNYTEDDYQCIQPYGNTETQSEDWKNPNRWPTASKCDVAEVSNLTLKTGPSLYLYMDTGTSTFTSGNFWDFYSQARKNQNATASDTGDKINDEISNTANNGKTPIQYFELQGHGRSDLEVASATLIITPNAFKPGDTQKWNPNSPTATYEKAKQKSYPRRCWFTKNARVFGFVCQGQKFGEGFAKNWLRKDAWIKTPNSQDNIISNPSLNFGFGPGNKVRINYDNITGLLTDQTNWVRKIGGL
jgi:hypothetical protein